MATDCALCCLAAMLLGVSAVHGCSLPGMEQCGQMQLFPGLAPRWPLAAA